MYLSTFFFCFIFAFIPLMVSIFNGGIIFIQSFIVSLLKFTIIGFVILTMISRVSPSLAFGYLNESSSIDQNYAVSALIDIAENPEGADKYVAQLDRFLENITDIASGEVFEEVFFEY